MRQKYLLLITGSFFMLLLLFGCGYKIQGRSSLLFREISIGRLDNRTLEPKLQDMLHRALTQELVKNGVTVTPTADFTLSGVVNSFEMVSLSEKAGITREYRVTVAGDFRVTDKTGKVIAERRVASPFIVAFPASEDMGSLIASKEVADEKAIADLAVEIAGALSYK